MNIVLYVHFLACWKRSLLFVSDEGTIMIQNVILISPDYEPVNLEMASRGKGPGQKYTWPGTGGLAVENSIEFGGYIVRLGHYDDVIPDPFDKMGLDGYAVVKADAVPTRAFDARYEDDDNQISAYVETSVTAGGPTQYLHVATGNTTLTSTATFLRLRSWLARLMNGGYNHLAIDPVILPHNQALRVSLPYEDH